jgi:hypothetical protein
MKTADNLRDDTFLDFDCNDTEVIDAEGLVKEQAKPRVFRPARGYAH